MNNIPLFTPPWTNQTKKPEMALTVKPNFRLRVFGCSQTSGRGCGDSIHLYTPNVIVELWRVFFFFFGRLSGHPVSDVSPVMNRDRKCHPTGRK